MSTEVKTSDLKKPKKFVMKFLNAMVSGGGAITQEMIHAKLVSVMGNVDSKIVSGLEWLVSALAAGSVDQEQLNAFLNGFSGGSAKDLLAAALNKFVPSMSLPNTAKGSTVNTPSVPSSGGTQYII